MTQQQQWRAFIANTRKQNPRRSRDNIVALKCNQDKKATKTKTGIRDTMRLETRVVFTVKLSYALCFFTTVTS